MNTSVRSTSPPSGKDLAPKPVDPELDSIRHLTRLLDRAYRNARIYGVSSPSAQRFVDQFHSDLTAHLRRYDVLSFVVQGYRLLSKGEIVYENSLPTENLAFKLFSDGIREFSLNQGLTKEDFAYLLETLGGEHEAALSDDDIVSSLWKKNLSTISLVTAEEIMKSIDSAAVMQPQESETMSHQASPVGDIHRSEVGRRTSQKGGSPAGKETERGRGGSSLAEFQVSPEELEALRRDIEEESARTSSTLILEMLTAILVSETAPAVLLKALEVFGDILVRLLRQGEWKLLNKLLGLLEEVEQRPDVPEGYRTKLAELYERLAQPAQLNNIAEALNPSPRANLDGLLTFLLRLTASAVPALCTLLRMLKHPGHRAVVCEAIVVLGHENPDPLLQELGHPTGTFVSELIEVLVRLAHSHQVQMEVHREVFSNTAMSFTERIAAALGQVANHTDSRVKREAIHAIGLLTPTGSGVPLVAFVQDSSEAVSLAALKQLTGGRYAVPLSLWVPVVSGKAFWGWPRAKKRAAFLAMSHTTGAEAVPYWCGLLTNWSLLNQKRVQELAVLAAEALGTLRTPEALAALAVGARRRDRVIRQACEAALRPPSPATRP